MESRQYVLGTILIVQTALLVTESNAEYDVSLCAKARDSEANALAAAMGLNCMNGPLLWQDHVPDPVVLTV